MAGRDPKYGSASVGFEDSLARMASQLAAVDRATAKLTATEAVSTRGLAANTSARVDQLRILGQQVSALDALTAALTTENSLLKANTAAWAQNAAARQGAAVEGGAATGAASVTAQSTAASAVKGGRYGGSTASFGGSLAGQATADTAALRNLEAQIARVERASGAAGVLATPLAVQRQALQAAQARLGAANVLATPAGLQQSAFEEQLRRLRASSQPNLGYSPLTGVGPSRGVFVSGPGGGPFTQATSRTASLGGEAASMGRLTAAEQEAAASAGRLNVQMAESAAVSAEVNSSFGRGVGIFAQADSALIRHGALSTEFISSFSRGEVTLRDFGNVMTQTIGKFAGWAVAGGLVYGAYNAIKKLGTGAIETQSGVSQLERSLPNVNKGEAAAGFRKLSREVNEPIAEAASAQFYAARAFPSQQGSLEVARTALLASKLDEVNPQDAVKTFSALNVSFKEGPKAIQKTFDELDIGQLKFNARLQQTLPFIGRAAPSFASAGGTPQELNEQIIELVRTTGGGGGTGGGNPATFLIREPSNLRRPEAQDTLREFGFKPQDAYTHVGRFNREVQQLAPSLSNSELQALAKAAGGGSALGLRYALPLFRAGQTSLPEEVHKEVANAQGEAAKDLEHKLGQVNEQIKKIGYTFESVGSQIGEGGFITVIKAVGSTIQFAARQIGAALGPFEALGKVFQGLPQGAQTAGLALGGAALVSRFAASDRGLATRGILGNIIGGPAGGLIYNQGASSLRDLRAQNSALLRHLESEQGGLGKRVLSTNLQARKAEQAYQADRAANPAFYALSNADRVGYGATSAGKERVATVAALEAERATSLGRAKAAEKAYTEHTALIGTAREGEGLLRGRGNIPAYNALFGGGVQVAHRTIGANIEPLTAAATAEASKETARTTVAVRKYGASLATDIQATRVATAEAETQIAASAAEATAASAAAASATGIAAIPGAVKGKVSGIFSRFSGGLFKALNAAFITSIGANIVGEALNSRSIEAAGPTAGLGAGLGALVGGVPGAVVGAGIGILATPYKAKLGLSQTLKYKSGEALEEFGIPQLTSALLGGETPYEERRKEEKEITVQAAKDEKKRLDERKKKIRQRVNKRRGGGSRPETAGDAERQELEYLGEEGLEEYEEASQQGGRGQEAAKKLAEQNKRLDALGKLERGTPSGKRALRELQARASSAIGLLAVHPEAAAQYAEDINTALTDTTSNISETFKNNLGAAGNKRDRNAALGTARNELQEGYANLYAHPRKRLEEQRDNDRYLQKQREAEAKSATGDTRTQLENQAKGFAAGADKTQKGVESYISALPEIRAALNNLGRELARAAVESNIQAIDVSTGLAVAKLGNDPAGKRAREEQGGREKAHEYSQAEKSAKQKGDAGALREAREKKEGLETEQAGRQESKAKEGLERAKAEAGLAESRAPAGEPLALAQIRAREASRIAELTQKSKAASPVEKLGAQAAANDAARAAAEAGQQRAVQEVQITGQIAQASEPGNAVAQAQTALSIAAKLKALATNPIEALQAQLLAVQAGNQLREALTQRIRLEGEYADSKTLDPLKRDRNDIATARKVLSKAVGPEEKIKAKTDLNNAITKRNEDLANVADEEIAFELHTNRLNVTQAVEKWQKLLHQGKISAQRRRDIQTKIYDAETANNRDFAVGSIKQAPTLYDALTLTSGRRASPGAAAGVPFSTIHHTPQLHQHNSIHINVAGGHPGQFAGEMERVFGSLTRSQLRSAGLS